MLIVLIPKKKYLLRKIFTLFYFLHFNTLEIKIIQPFDLCVNIKGRHRGGGTDQILMRVYSGQPGNTVRRTTSQQSALTSLQYQRWDRDEREALHQLAIPQCSHCLPGLRPPVLHLFRQEVSMCDLLRPRPGDGVSLNILSHQTKSHADTRQGSIVW